MAEIQMMLRGHIDAVLRIEQESFSHPWGLEDFAACCRQGSVDSKVLRVGQVVAGYMLYDVLPDEVFLLSVAVAPTFRRQGLGAKMIAKLKGLLCGRRVRLATEVRETNLLAQMFFRAMDFRAVGVIEGYYEAEGCDEDAYLFESVLPPL